MEEGRVTHDGSGIDDGAAPSGGTAAAAAAAAAPRAACCVVCLCGLPGAGKSTVAERLRLAAAADGGALCAVTKGGGQRVGCGTGLKKTRRACCS